MAEALLRVDNLYVSYTSKEIRRVLASVDLTCEAGEITSVIGRSGVGKTTLLKSIAGLIEFDKGRILVEGCEVTAPGPDRSLVFQEYPVFPWLTVLENVEIGVRSGSVPLGHQDARKRARELLKAIGLLSREGEFPRVLSGGMRQRVALARALGTAPAVLLLDEPFGSLDAITRREVQELVRALHREHRQAIVLVTHDIAEAVLLSDKVCVLGPDRGESGARIRGVWRVPEPRSKAEPEDLGEEERGIMAEARAAMATAGRES